MARTAPAPARGGLWLIPVTCVLVGVMVSIGTMWLDRASDFELVPRWITGGPDAALGILTTIAISMVSLATLVLTITMVVVQLAMGQFSPRIVQTFLRDRPSQLAIGMFVATFAHSMLAMREISSRGRRSRAWPGYRRGLPPGRRQHRRAHPPSITPASHYASRP